MTFVNDLPLFYSLHLFYTFFRARSKQEVFKLRKKMYMSLLNLPWVRGKRFQNLVIHAFFIICTRVFITDDYKK